MVSVHERSLRNERAASGHALSYYGVRVLGTGAAVRPLGATGGQATAFV